MHVSVANMMSLMLPATRGFGLRRWGYRAAGVRIGNSTRICGGARFLGTNVNIGDGTWIGYASILISTERAEIEIGEHCDVGPGAMFVVGTHEPGAAERRAGTETSAPIAIGSGTWIGARVTFLAGSSVGSGSIVAAGSVVTRSHPGNVLLAGVPATVVRELPGV